MGELSIRIKIGDREYPLKVEHSEEARLRKAGVEINNRIKTLKEQFGLDDMQDLLAMVSFDLIVNDLKINEEKVVINPDIASKVEELVKKIDQHIDNQ